jgi:hypothetical protein
MILKSLPSRFTAYSPPTRCSPRPACRSIVVNTSLSSFAHANQRMSSPSTRATGLGVRVSSSSTASATRPRTGTSAPTYLPDGESASPANSGCAKYGSGACGASAAHANIAAAARASAPPSRAAPLRMRLTMPMLRSVRDAHAV